MPPKRTGDAPSKRSQPTGAKAKASAVPDEESDNPFESTDDEAKAARRNKRARQAEDDDDVQVVRDGEEEEIEKTIPKELLTRLLHEFFTKDSTRISRDANATVGKYFDVFVREAIARTAVEKQGGFLEVRQVERIEFGLGFGRRCIGPEVVADGKKQVEDLEKVTPQLLLDL